MTIWGLNETWKGSNFFTRWFNAIMWIPWAHLTTYHDCLLFLWSKVWNSDFVFVLRWHMKLGGTGWANHMPCPPCSVENVPWPNNPPNYRDQAQSLLTPPWQASAFRIVKTSQSHLLQEPGVTLSSFSHWGCPHERCLFILFPSKMLWEAEVSSPILDAVCPTIPIFLGRKSFSHHWDEEEAITAQHSSLQAILY